MRIQKDAKLVIPNTLWVVCRGAALTRAGNSPQQSRTRAVLLITGCHWLLQS